MKLYRSISFCSLAIALLMGSSTQAQQEKFQGQEPIQIVPTEARPVQKQWKGSYVFDQGALEFNNDFEGARLNGVVKTNDSTYTALITSENTPINISPWYAFQVKSKEARSIYVILTYQDGYKHRYYPKTSTDGSNWKALDSIHYTEIEPGTQPFGAESMALKAQLRLEVGPEPRWVAGQELETSTHVKAWAERISEKDFAKLSTIGESREGRPMHLLSIGNTDSKRMIMVISRQHPPEVTGYLAMKAFVETITGDSELAKKFREKYATFVVPLMNPDGVDNGHWRHNAGGIDLNRDWAQFNHPETQAVRDFMKRQEDKSGGKFYFGIDFHSTWDDIYYTLDEKFKGNMPGLIPEWLASMKGALEGYDPNIRPNERLEPTAVSMNYFLKAHGAESLVFEIGDNTDRDFIKDKGRVSAEKLMELLLEKK